MQTSYEVNLHRTGNYLKKLLPVVVAGLAGCGNPGAGGNASSSVSKRKPQVWARAEVASPIQQVEGLQLQASGEATSQRLSGSFSAFTDQPPPVSVPKNNAKVSAFLNQLEQKKRKHSGAADSLIATITDGFTAPEKSTVLSRMALT